MEVRTVARPVLGLEGYLLAAFGLAAFAICGFPGNLEKNAQGMASKR
jgi:hypothetical protein